jgi:phospholipid/cholesterol/gamma-HCH transport system substrate-binding protein
MATTLGRIYRVAHRQIYGVLFIGLLVFAFLFIVGLYNKSLPWQHSVDVNLETPRIGNQLNLGGDVKMRGAFVGTIKAIKDNGDHATVKLALSPKEAKTIPDNVDARILPKTIFGEKYVDLVVPANNPPDQRTFTAKGANRTIKIDQSKIAIETDQVFNDLLPLLRTLQPVKLNQTLNALATALQERGNSLGQNLDLNDKYFSGLNPDLATINQDISGLADLAANYGDAAPDLLRLAKDSAISLQEVVVPKPDQLFKFFTGTKDFAVTTNRILKENESNFIALAANSRPILDVLATYSTEFPCLLRGLTDIQPRLEGTFANGPFLYVHLEVMKDQQSRLYVDPADNPQTPGSDLYNYQNYAPGPSCNGLPYPNAPANYPHPGVSSATVAANEAALRATAYGDIGPVGSSYEKDLVSIIAAPMLNIAPRDVPGLADLLLAPLMRGTAVSLG